MQFMLSLSCLVQHFLSASTVPRVPIALPSETNGRRPVLPCLPTVKRAQRSRRSTLAYPRTCSMPGAALLEPIGNVSVAGCHRTVPELAREAQGQPILSPLIRQAGKGRGELRRQGREGDVGNCVCKGENRWLARRFFSSPPSHPFSPRCHTLLTQGDWAPVPLTRRDGKQRVMRASRQAWAQRLAKPPVSRDASSARAGPVAVSQSRSFLPYLLSCCSLQVRYGSVQSSHSFLGTMPEEGGTEKASCLGWTDRQHLSPRRIQVREIISGLVTYIPRPEPTPK